MLVSGAAGFLGTHVVKCLLRNGHDVRAIVRPASSGPFSDEKVEVFRADLRTTNLTPAFKDVDAVVHLAAGTSGNEDVQFASSVVGTERFLAAMAETTAKRLIHVSSLVVYDWAAAKGTLDEGTPLLKKPYAMGGYAIAKVWQERVVEEFSKKYSWDLTIIRPGFIWGKDHAEIAGMGRHFRSFYLMFGPFTRLPLSHVMNCADCLVAAVERPAAVGQTFNVIDGDEIRVWRYVLEYMRGTGQRGLMIPLPYFVGYGIARLASLSSRLLFEYKGKLPSLLTPDRFEAQFKPIRFSRKKLRDLLQWDPPVTFKKSLRMTYGDR